MTFLSDLDWLVTGSSVRGSSHRRARTPNQDAILMLPGDRDGPLVAIADGHGSARSFRSDVGARLAVAAAARCVREARPAFGSMSDVGKVERRARALSGEIVASWREMVAADLREQPFSDVELATLQEVGEDAFEHIRVEPLVAYGATLLLCVAFGRRLAMLQIGDGDILVVSGGDDPTIARPIPADERLVGNVTTSLCVADADRDFRVAALEIDGPRAPELVIMTTDGYANSFVDDAAFLQAGPDVLRMLHQRGIDWVGEQLPAWLEAASRQGSGDDITMAIAWRGRAGSRERAARAFAEAGSADTRVPGKASAAPGAGKVSSRGLAIRVVLLVIGLGLGAMLGSWLFGDAGSGTSEQPSVAPSASATVSRDDDRSTWAWDGGTGLVELIDGEPIGRTLQVPELRGHGPVRDVEAGFDALWISVAEGALIRVDPAQPGQVEVIKLDGEPAGVSIGRRLVVVSSSTGDTVYLVLPRPPYRASTVRLSDEVAGDASPTPSPSSR